MVYPKRYWAHLSWQHIKHANLLTLGTNLESKNLTKLNMTNKKNRVCVKLHLLIEIAK